jgi:hypothetical protein
MQTEGHIGKRRLDCGKAEPLASGGQNLVELALTLPVLLLLLFGIIELGRTFLIYSEVSNAAREGARYAVVHPGDLTPIAGAARAKVAVVPRDDIAVAVGYDDGSLPTPNPVATPTFGDRVVVSVTHDLALLTPLIGDLIGPLHIEMVSARTILGGE